MPRAPTLAVNMPPLGAHDQPAWSTLRRLIVSPNTSTEQLTRGLNSLRASNSVLNYGLVTARNHLEMVLDAQIAALITTLGSARQYKSMLTEGSSVMGYDQQRFKEVIAQTVMNRWAAERLMEHLD